MDERKCQPLIKMSKIIMLRGMHDDLLIHHYVPVVDLSALINYARAQQSTSDGSREGAKDGVRH